MNTLLRFKKGGLESPPGKRSTDLTTVAFLYLPEAFPQSGQCTPNHPMSYFFVVTSCTYSSSKLVQRVDCTNGT